MSYPINGHWAFGAHTLYTGTTLNPINGLLGGVYGLFHFFFFYASPGVAWGGIGDLGSLLPRRGAGVVRWCWSGGHNSQYEQNSELKSTLRLSLIVSLNENLNIIELRFNFKSNFKIELRIILILTLCPKLGRLSWVTGEQLASLKYSINEVTVNLRTFYNIYYIIICRSIN